MITKEKVEHAEEQIYQQQKIVDFDTREFTIEYVVNKYLLGVDNDENEIYVPDYQREFVWEDFRQSKLIESIILGLPIPLIFLAENRDKDNRLEIVDGSQRIRTLASFLNNNLALDGLEKLDTLNGFTFENLSSSRQRKFKNTPLRMVVLSDKATDEVRNEIFERINRGSELLQAMEKRKGIYRGAFTTFIYEICAKDDLFNKLTKIDLRQVNRQEKEELILRFFALSDNYKIFPSRTGIAKFLDGYLESKNLEFDNLKSKTPNELKENDYYQLKNYYVRFIDMLKRIELYFPHGFTKNNTGQVSRVYFEAISVGTYQAIKDNPKFITTKAKVLLWLNSEEFNGMMSGKYQTHNPERIKQRIDFVKNKLLSNG